VVSAAHVYCWGANAGAGQLAVGDLNPRVAPTPTTLVATTAISIGDDHGCAIENGAAVCWGHNDDGALGFGSMNPQNNPSPVGVVGAPTVLPSIAGWHACDLAAGTVRCWGEGDHGEVGDGLGTNTATPTVVPGAANATAIAVGGGPADLDATCAVIAGDVKCWGNGGFGRLGQGVAANSNVPIAVVGLPGPAHAVALGYAHSCALLVDGDLWCWGRGNLGQLGDGMSANSLVPVRVVRPL
jgi:alpha-tubulin suppressor-like RCC1 family protein